MFSFSKSGRSDATVNIMTLGLELELELGFGGRSRGGIWEEEGTWNKDSPQTKSRRKFLSHEPSATISHVYLTGSMI